jgi:glutamate--cysteine ligase
MRPWLQALVQDKKWEVDYESEGNLLGIKKNLNAISLEPGGQFEVSAAPQKTLQEVRNLQEKIDAELFSLSLSKSWQFFNIGVNPFEHEDLIEILPSPRYRLMDEYFKKTGRRGRQMMRLTTGVQVNLDFSSEAEAVVMLQASFRAVPVLATVFANSPYYHGKPSGTLSERHRIWLDTDPLRSGFLDFIFDETFSFKKYIDHLSKLPLMYYFGESGSAEDPKGKSYSDLPAALRKKNAVSCMRQLFTEVRYKPCCVELRCFDQLSPADRYAAVAMSVGLLYDEENRAWLNAEFRDFKAAELSLMMDEGAVKGLKTGRIYALALEFLKRAEMGLVRRGYGEEKFLVAAENLIRSTETPAERLLRKFGDL